MNQDIDLRMPEEIRMTVPLNAVCKECTSIVHGNGLKPALQQSCTCEFLNGLGQLVWIY